MGNQSKKSYNEKVLIYEEVKWLCEYNEKFEELLKLYSSDQEKALIFDLIRRFRFLHSCERNDFILEVIDKVFKQWKCEPGKTIIVPMVDDEDIDTSHGLVTSLRVAVANCGYEYVKHLNTIDAVPNCVSKGRNKIVIIEHFIGSGTKISPAIEKLKNKCSDCDFFICSIAAMKAGKQLIDGLDLKDTYIKYELEKGISDLDTQSEEKLNLMLQMENKLKIPSKTEYFPFGYKQSETLFHMEGSNAVNNLFPIFWWNKLKNSDKRETMFVRAW